MKRLKIPKGWRKLERDKARRLYDRACEAEWQAQNRCQNLKARINELLRQKREAQRRRKRNIRAKNKR